MSGREIFQKKFLKFLSIGNALTWNQIVLPVNQMSHSEKF